MTLQDNELKQGSKDVIAIDEQKLDIMYASIYAIEKKNSKTLKYTDTKMKEIIEGIIEREAKL